MNAEQCARDFLYDRIGADHFHLVFNHLFQLMRFPQIGLTIRQRPELPLAPYLPAALIVGFITPRSFCEQGVFYRFKMRLRNVKVNLYIIGFTLLHYHLTWLSGWWIQSHSHPTRTVGISTAERAGRILFKSGCGLIRQQFKPLLPSAREKTVI